VEAPEESPSPVPLAEIQQLELETIIDEQNEELEEKLDNETR